MEHEVAEGTLGGEFDRSDRANIQSSVAAAEDAAKDEVWGGYRFAVIADAKDADGLKVIDLGAGHSSSGETLCGRVITALKSQALLNESVGTGYIERNWPPALKGSGAWPLAGLRKSFLDGSLTRLLDPDTVLKAKIVEFVTRGDFGLASGPRPDGNYERVWHGELVAPDEVAFEAGVFLLTRERAQALKKGEIPKPVEPTPKPQPPEPKPVVKPGPDAKTRTFRLTGKVPPELWNRLGTRIIPKLKAGSELQIGIDVTVTVGAEAARSFEGDLRQVLDDLGLADKVKVE
ncbi:MAG: hypothetical protein FJ272_17730 [Planctomycetes bacterium]|nr:hypothetical protein [Planctomycetota bacterium]